MKKILLIILICLSVLFPFNVYSFGNSIWDTIRKAFTFLKYDIIPAKPDVRNLGSADKPFNDISWSGVATGGTIDATITSPGNSGEILFNNSGVVDAITDITTNGTSDLTAIGTVQAEHIASTDDADIADNLTAGDIVIDEAAGVLQFSGATSNTILTEKGILTLGGTGNTNNENLTLDFENSSNVVVVNSTTSLNDVFFRPHVRIADDRSLYLGNGYDTQMRYVTVGNDHLGIATTTGSSTGSGNIVVCEKADMTNANRSPSISADPTIWLFSNDETQDLDYGKFFHDQTDFNIDVGQGDLKLYPSANGNITTFEDIDIGDDDDGKMLFVHRKAAEGDTAISLYGDQFQNSIVRATTASGSSLQLWNDTGKIDIKTTNTDKDIDIEPTGDLKLHNLAVGDITLFELSDSGENNFLRQYGYITAGTAAKYIAFQINDTTDYYELTREDSNILGFDVQMPMLITANDLTLTDGNIIQNDETVRRTSELVADDGEITVATGTAGSGFVTVGDNEEWAQFVWAADGTVSIPQGSTNTRNTDTDGNLCIYDVGAGIAIKIRLGTPKIVSFTLNYR